MPSPRLIASGSRALQQHWFDSKKEERRYTEARSKSWRNLRSQQDTTYAAQDAPASARTHGGRALDGTCMLSTAQGASKAQASWEHFAVGESNAREERQAPKSSRRSSGHNVLQPQPNANSLPSRGLVFSADGDAAYQPGYIDLNMGFVSDDIGVHLEVASWMSASSRSSSLHKRLCQSEHTNSDGSIGCRQHAEHCSGEPSDYASVCHFSRESRPSQSELGGVRCDDVSSRRSFAPYEEHVRSSSEASACATPSAQCSPRPQLEHANSSSSRSDVPSPQQSPAPRFEHASGGAHPLLRPRQSPASHSERTSLTSETDGSTSGSSSTVPTQSSD